MGILDTLLAPFFPKPMPLDPPALAIAFGRMQDWSVIRAGSYDRFEDTIQIPGALPTGWSWWTNQEADTPWRTARCRPHGQRRCTLLRDGVRVASANDDHYGFHVTVHGTDPDDTHAIVRVVRALVERGERAHLAR